jgi:hypothetical protein
MQGIVMKKEEIFGDDFLIKGLNEFYAGKLGISVNKWVESCNDVIIGILYDGRTREELSEAIGIVREGYKHIPPDLESSWTEKDGTKFTEYFFHGKQRRGYYFKEIKKILILEE